MSRYVEPVQQLVTEIVVTDIKRSVAFYQRLGFELLRDGGDFVELTWDDHRLFLAEPSAFRDVREPALGMPPPFPLANVRVMVPNVDECWRLANEIGAKVIVPVADRYYGLRDFTIADPDGFGVRFASVLQGGFARPLFRIRDYAAQDAAQLEHCIVELQSFEKAIEPNRADGFKIAGAYRELLLTQCHDRRGKIFVAQADEAVIAFTCVLSRVDGAELIEEDPEYAYITDLVVLPTYRGRGIGRALLQHAETYALEQGATVLKVDAVAANKVARKLYGRIGYHEHEVRLQKRLQPVDQSAA